jgi:hypothetical protein
MLIWKLEMSRLKNIWSLIINLIPGLALIPWCCIIGPFLSLTTMGTAMAMDHSIATYALPIILPLLSYNHFRFWRSWLKNDWNRCKKFWWWFTWRFILLVISTTIVIYSTYNYINWVPSVQHHHH